MKKLYVFLLFMFFGPELSAQQQRLQSAEPSNLVITNTAEDYISEKKNISGVLFEDFTSVSKIIMMEKEAPALPMFSRSLELPATGKTSIVVSYESYNDYDGVNVQPSKGSLTRNINPDNIAFKFGEKYNQNAFFPGNLATVSTPFILRNTRGATITFYPYQYNPVTKKLRVYKNITVNVITDESATGLNEISNLKQETTSVFSAMYKNLYMNSAVRYEPISDQGSMLIITPASYAASLQSFVNWKIEKGIATTVVNLAQTGTNAQSVKNYIKTFYDANPSLAYVLLVGDHEQVPSYTYGISGANEQLWSDSFYGQTEGTDFFPELLVGRFSGSIADVQTMITRTLEYEINPLVGNWTKNAIGIASDEGAGVGNDGEADWQHLRNIGEKLIAFGYDEVYEFYDGSHGVNDLDQSPTSAMISAAINEGVGLVNYTGHGWSGGVSTGDYTSSSVNLLTNQGKYPFVVSVACNNGTFIGDDSVCEVFVRAKQGNNPTGAIASCGSSILMAWAEPMQAQDEMTELIIRSNATNIQTTLGGLFYNSEISMLETYNQSNTAEQVMQTWVLFGDPSTAFRSKVTADITANHLMLIPDGEENLVINSNTNGAMVSITQNNQIIATSQIVSGTASLAIPVLTSASNLKVTLTKENTKPYRGQIAIASLSSTNFDKQIMVYPNPVSSLLNISTSGKIIDNATIQLFDSLGRSVYLENNVSLLKNYSIPVSNFALGLYILKIKDGNNTKTLKIQIN